MCQGDKLLGAPNQKKSVEGKLAEKNSMSKIKKNGTLAPFDPGGPFRQIRKGVGKVSKEKGEGDGAKGEEPK